jgi:hypothetical protein
MARSGSKFNTELWERGFAALSRFRAHEGHCCPMQTSRGRQIPMFGLRAGHPAIRLAPEAVSMR